MSTKTRVTVPSQPQRAGTVSPKTASTEESRHPSRTRTALAVTTVLVAAMGVAALWISLGSGSQTEAPSQPNVETFVSEVPPGIDGSDWRLYVRAKERQAQLQAQQESASGSDRHLAERGGMTIR